MDGLMERAESMKLYRATAHLNGGQQIQYEGSSDECVLWCEDVIRANGSDITVKITFVGWQDDQE